MLLACLYGCQADPPPPTLSVPRPTTVVAPVGVHTQPTHDDLLRQRLQQTLFDLYAATPADKRDAMLSAMLSDPLAEVRLAGEILMQIAANEEVCEPLQQVRQMLNDTDVRVRRVAAMLLASDADPQAVIVLLDRLGKENQPVVLQAILTAMGQLQDPACVPAVLDELQSDDMAVAAAAAAALRNLVAKTPLEPPLRQEAIDRLLARYRLATRQDNGPGLREALLAAMGEVQDAAFEPTLVEALKDESATVRLAAVNGLARLGDAKTAADIVPLTQDEDRGVRQAAIVALGQMKARQYLMNILARTEPAVETDEQVRQRAWEVVMDLLEDASPQTLEAVSDYLANRDDALAQRIKIMQMINEKLPDDHSLRKSLRHSGIWETH